MIQFRTVRDAMPLAWPSGDDWELSWPGGNGRCGCGGYLHHDVSRSVSADGPHDGTFVQHGANPEHRIDIRDQDLSSVADWIRRIHHT